MVKEHGAYDITFGMGSSPRLWGDLLYVSCMTKGASYVVAFDKLTGKQAWKTDRQLAASDDGPDAYSSPTIARMGKRVELLVAGSDHVNAYDLKSGKQNWISSGLLIDSPYGRVIASPVAHQGIVVATSANPGGGGLGQGDGCHPEGYTPPIGTGVVGEGSQHAVKVRRRRPARGKRLAGWAGCAPRRRPDG